LHFIDEGVDTGDIAFQERFTLSEEEDVGDALRKLYPLYEQLTICAIQGLQANALPRHPQDHSLATVFPKRTPDDGRIDWAWSATRVLNLTRALSKPYPGAFTSLDGRRLLIWKARIGHPTLLLGPRGSILDDGSVCCNPGILMVTNAEWEDDPGVRVDLAAFASSGFED
jgi:methionyl-tRNA formyltransferase